MWQKCPNCQGLGVVSPSGLSNHTQEQCSVCKGHKIINELTGLPPVFKFDSTQYKEKCTCKKSVTSSGGFICDGNCWW